MVRGQPLRFVERFAKHRPLRASEHRHLWLNALSSPRLASTTASAIKCRRNMKWIAKQDARHRFLIALVLATVVWFALSRHLQSSTRCIITWDSFAITTLILAWLTIVTTPADKLHARAQKQDLSHIFIFIFVLGTACAGLFAVGFLFFSKQAFQEPSHFWIHLFGSLIAVVCSWMLVHTVFGLRYGHAYY